MGKIIPQDRKSTFMGFYSTFTYLGISVVSLVNAILRQLDLPTHILLLILFIWAVPAYLFMMILRRNTDKPKREEDLSPLETQAEPIEEVHRSINKDE
jgi:MFS-type transporter involved in bile tolerance (Atg22 family)